MDKRIFKENLLKSIDELAVNLNIELDSEIKFVITPIMEKGKKYSSKDDYLRLWIFSEKNLDRHFDLEQVIDLFTGLAPLVPIWINVLLKKKEETSIIFELQTSLRFRKPSILQNQETGHPPFKSIY